MFHLKERRKQIRESFHQTAVNLSSERHDDLIQLFVTVKTEANVLIDPPVFRLYFLLLYFIICTASLVPFQVHSKHFYRDLNKKKKKKFTYIL